MNTMRVRVVTEVVEKTQDRPGGWLNAYEAEVEKEDGEKLTVYSQGVVATELINARRDNKIVVIEVTVVEQDGGGTHLVVESVDGKHQF